MSDNSKDERILTLNFDGKKGVNILKSKYEVVKHSIISILSKVDSMPMSQLSQKVKNELEEDFEGKIGWYFMAVKLDLEVRGEIEKVPKVTPQTLRIK